MYVQVHETSRLDLKSNGFKTQKSRNKLTRTKRLDIVWAQLPLHVSGMSMVKCMTWICCLAWGSFTLVWKFFIKCCVRCIVITFNDALNVFLWSKHCFESRDQLNRWPRTYNHTHWQFYNRPDLQSSKNATEVLEEHYRRTDSDPAWPLNQQSSRYRVTSFKNLN
jgi:hypothetical protein